LLERNVTEPTVYLNGTFLPASTAHIAIYDVGFVQGATVTEQTRTFHHLVYGQADHLDRFFRALLYTGIDIGLSHADLLQIGERLIEHNAALLDSGDELGLIYFATPGEYRTYAPGQARSTPTVCAHTFVLPFELWAEKLKTGTQLITPSIRHVPPQCVDSTIKCRSRVHFYLAEREAKLADPEASALLLDLDGFIAETNAANFFMVVNRTLVSPMTRNTLPGISRMTVIELAGELGVSFVERDTRLEEAMDADEAFLSSTPFCLMPIRRINERTIADGKPGPMYRRLLDAWSRRVGLDIEKQIIDGGARRLAARGPHATGETTS
jgi:branched-subunit amino acid aminotransferase/4-amino-4-deoxychorismate lyase